jgi:hypothetical protein
MRAVSAWLLAVLLGLGLCSGTANAAVIKFNGNISGNDTGTLTAILVVTDAAYLSGGFNFSIQPQFSFVCGPVSVFGPCLIAGDADGFVSFTDSYVYGEGFTSNSATGRLSIGLSFNPDGTTTGSISLRGLYQDLDIGSSGVGFVSADYSPCYYIASHPTCQVTGSFSTQGVPEPSSGLVMGPTLGLFLAALLRRKVVQPMKKRS